MDDDVRQFGTELGTAVLAREWSTAHALLAPWLRNKTTPAQVQAFFEDEYRLTLEANGITELLHPAHPEPQLDGNNFMNATKLREPISFAGGKVRDIAPEMTDAMVRYWMSMRLVCSDEQMNELDFDQFCETWISVVETDEGLRVGYWSQGAY